MYATHDIDLACTLLALGYEMTGMVHDETKKSFEFQFESKATMEKDIPMFMRRDMRVEPKVLLHSYKILKSKIYEGFKRMETK